MRLPPNRKRYGIRLFEESDSCAALDAGRGLKVLVAGRIPYGAGGSVVENEDVVHRVAGRTERDFFSVDFASVDHGQPVERSPSNGHRLAAHRVIDQFVFVEDLEGIGPGVAIMHEADNRRSIVDSEFAQARVVGGDE